MKDVEQDLSVVLFVVLTAVHDISKFCVEVNNSLMKAN